MAARGRGWWSLLGIHVAIVQTAGVIDFKSQMSIRTPLRQCGRHIFPAFIFIFEVKGNFLAFHGVSVSKKPDSGHRTCLWTPTPSRPDVTANCIRCGKGSKQVRLCTRAIPEKNSIASVSEKNRIFSRVVLMMRFTVSQASFL